MTNAAGTPAAGATTCGTATCAHCADRALRGARRGQFPMEALCSP